MGSFEQQTSHLQQLLRKEQKTRTMDNMRIILVVSFLVGTAFSLPAPSPGGHGCKTDCNIEYVEKEEKVCKTVCKTYTEPVCKKVKYEKICINKTKTQCEPECKYITKSIPKKVCKQVPKNICHH